MAAIRFAPISFAPVLAVARAMRDIDAREVYGRLPEGRAWPHGLAYAVMQPGPVGEVASIDGVPGAVFGAHLLHEAAASVFMFATSAWPELAAAVHRRALDVIEPELRRRGVHRLECQSLAERRDAHDWLRRLGFEAEGLHRAQGRGREDYITFAKVYPPPAAGCGIEREVVPLCA